MAVAKGPVGQVLAGPTFRSGCGFVPGGCGFTCRVSSPYGYYTGWFLLLKLVWRVWLFQLNTHKPHQPLSFNFPKRSFGQWKGVFSQVGLQNGLSSVIKISFLSYLFS